MGIKFQRSSLLLIITLSLMLILASAQRGGSRSSSSRSRSSSRRSHHYYGSLHRSQNCTTVNGTTTCTYVDEPLSWTAIAIFLGICGAFMTFAIISGKKDT
jgi:hypothetical protein